MEVATAGVVTSRGAAMRENPHIAPCGHNPARSRAARTLWPAVGTSVEDAASVVVTTVPSVMAI